MSQTQRSRPIETEKEKEEAGKGRGGHFKEGNLAVLISNLLAAYLLLPTMGPAF